MLQEFDCIFVLNHLYEFFIQFYLSTHILTVFEWNRDAEFVLGLFAFLEFAELESCIFVFKKLE